MEQISAKIIDWIKQSAKPVIAIGLTSAFMVFAPSNVLQFFGVTEIRSQYLPFLSLAFLFCACLLIIILWEKYASLILEERAFVREARKFLHKLTPEERKILKGYIDSQSRTQALDMMNGVVNGLEHSKVVYRSANMGRSLQSWPYNIQPWAWDYLNKHPELLD